MSCNVPEIERSQRTEAVITKLNECLAELDALNHQRAAVEIDSAIIRLGGEPVMMPEDAAMLSRLRTHIAH